MQKHNAANLINPRTMSLCAAMSAHADNALVLLEWYRAAGVDEAIAESPQDWFAREYVRQRPVLPL